MLDLEKLSIEELSELGEKIRKEIRCRKKEDFDVRINKIYDAISELVKTHSSAVCYYEIYNEDCNEPIIVNLFDCFLDTSPKNCDF